MLRFQQRIAEGETDWYVIAVHEVFDGDGICIAKTDTAASPDTLGRRPIDGANVTPFIEELPVLMEQREEGLIEVVKLEDAGEVVEN